MASLKLRRSIHPAAARSCCNWISGRPVSTEAVVRQTSTPAPWMMIEDGGFEAGINNMVYNFYNLADKQVISVDKKRGKNGMVVGSSHGWLALMKWRRHLYKWRRIMWPKVCGMDMLLYNPLSHRHVDLPPLETLRIPRHKLSKGWGCPQKLILSCSPDEDDEDQCRAVMFFGKEHRLAYCCPGRSKEWIPFGDLFHENERINDIFRGDEPSNIFREIELIDGDLRYSIDRFPRIYEDIVYSHKKQSLFCMTMFGYFESWDLRDPLSPMMNWKLFDRDMVFSAAGNRCPHCGRSERDAHKQKPSSDSPCIKYLVFAEGSERLFLVSRHVKTHQGPDGCHDYSVPYQTVGFNVHEIIVSADGKKGDMRYMDGNLDGMSFFVGSKGHGFVIEEMVDDNNGRVLEPNSIYFTDPNQLTPPPWNKKIAACGGHDIGIFNYENSTFSPCYYPRDLQSARRMNPTPTWFTPSSS